MSLKLHLHLDEHGRGKHLYVFDGERLVGELAARSCVLHAYEGDSSHRPTLAVDFDSRHFTIEASRVPRT